MSNQSYIKDGRVYGIKFSEYFNVRLGDDENPSICPVVAFDGMPVKPLVKLAFDSMKVRGRPAMKKMDAETLKKVYKGTISWRVMLSKEGAAVQQAAVEMTDEELDAQIERYRALRNRPKDDQAVEDSETE